MTKMILDFNQWNELNEASVFSKISDWFQTTFGKSYGKLKTLLEEYRDLETKFVDEWQDIIVEIDKLELKRDQTQNDPAEQKTIQRFITRNKELMDSIEKSHKKSIDYLMAKVKKVINEEQKLRNFWELNKSKIDAEIAEDMYKKSKDLADVKYSENLYRKYRTAVDNAKQKDIEFKERYGSVISTAPKPPVVDDVQKKIELQEPTIDLYSTMSLGDFTKLLQGMTPKEAKNLAGSLIRQRNEFYVKLEMEREIINKQIDAKEINRDEAAKRIKAVREMYMDKIRDLRSKITVARQYA
jgi:hypothetical protein